MRLFGPPHACFRCDHSSSSLPLQSAAYASASTRSLCAPQRAHNAVSFCPVCSSSGQRPTSRAPAARRAPCYRLVWRFGGRAPPQLQRVLALSPPRVGRLPSALLRTTCALSARNRCSRSSPSPPASPLGEPAKLNSSHASAERNNLRSTAATLPKSKKWVRTEVASLLSRATNVPALEQRFLDCGLPRGTAASSEHRGRQGIKLTTDSGSVWMQASLRAAKTRPVPLTRLPLITSLLLLPLARIETHDAARARGCWRSSHDGPLTVLYCVPTNPGPRSFCARPVRRYRWRRS